MSFPYFKDKMGNVTGMDFFSEGRGRGKKQTKKGDGRSK
jgi:hypothetical protein